MAELADAHGSGPCESNFMRVQVPFPARIPGVSSRDRLRKCRNWQTSKIKVLVTDTSCGFKSHLPHGRHPKRVALFFGFEFRKGRELGIGSGRVLTDQATIDELFEILKEIIR